MILGKYFMMPACPRVPGVWQAAPNVAHFSFQHEENCIFKYMGKIEEKLFSLINKTRENNKYAHRMAMPSTTTTNNNNNETRNETRKYLKKLLSVIDSWALSVL